jgi:hypothetical protein
VSSNKRIVKDIPAGTKYDPAPAPNRSTSSKFYQGKAQAWCYLHSCEHTWAEHLVTEADGEPHEVRPLGRPGQSEVVGHG